MYVNIRQIKFCKKTGKKIYVLLWLLYAVFFKIVSKKYRVIMLVYLSFYMYNLRELTIFQGNGIVIHDFVLVWSLYVVKFAVS